jgi:hypothetical protein
MPVIEYGGYWTFLQRRLKKTSFPADTIIFHITRCLERRRRPTGDPEDLADGREHGNREHHLESF